MIEKDLESTNLKSISIDELIRGENKIPYCFIVPSYQRGYRWDEQQIKKLLDDLEEFRLAVDKRDSYIGNYYCLQPIIVKALDQDQAKEHMGCNFIADQTKKYYEIVDGQQRITTIYILLKYLSLREPKCFFIEYARDAKSNYSRKYVLENLKNEDLKPNTVDEVYFIEAYNVINNWLLEKSENNSNIYNNIETVLKEKTKVIWYELDEQISNFYDVFRNINNGKIPLTDAELVKAMLLNSKLFASQTNSNTNTDREAINKIVRKDQERYARLWDDIQHTLSDNQLWSFITGNHNFKTPTRIDFLLQLAVMKSGYSFCAEPGNLFAYYEEELAKLNSIEKKREYAESVFQTLRKLFRTIQDWYETPIYFNYIGMIMTYTKKAKASEEENRKKRLETLIDIMECYDSNTKDNFTKELMNRACKLIGKVTPKFMGYENVIEDKTQEIAVQDEVEEDDEDEIVVDKDSYVDKFAVNYNKNRKDIEKWLMLFNILELNEMNEKFDFTIGESGWSVEHIKAQHSEVAKSEDWKGFLLKEKERIGEGFDEIKREIDAVIALDTDFKTPLENIMKKIDHDVDGFDEIDEHRLGNLALLGKDDNSSFNNSQFYEKRDKMLKKKDGNFPYSTRRVFLKVYSQQTYDLDYSKWCKEDFNRYLARQYFVLKAFLKEIKKEAINNG